MDSALLLDAYNEVSLEDLCPFFGKFWIFIKTLTISAMFEK
jgi:hypothetical protein